MWIWNKNRVKKTSKINPYLTPQQWPQNQSVYGAWLARKSTTLPNGFMALKSVPIARQIIVKMNKDWSRDFSADLS
jgi:hypothetical protein